MKCYVGLGSNRGRRLENLERAGAAIRALSAATNLRASPVYETAALLPEGAPLSWDSPFLNAVIELEWSGTAQGLLAELQKTESDLGRIPAPRWAPRLIDLDILFFGDERIATDELTVPHPRLGERGFVLSPLRDLAPEFLARARECGDPVPLWMGILNVTPDSFSDGGSVISAAHAATIAREWAEIGVGIIDIGAESTRPGADEITRDQEWERLRGPLLAVAEALRHRLFRPKISVDTRHAATAAKALALGADWINDVSALGDPAMAQVLREHDCECILMHNRSAPEFLAWGRDKLAEAERAGLKRERLILDPGLGFGKTPEQSRALVREIGRLRELGVRIAVGHSRKGFLSPAPPAERDGESVALSLALAANGVEILRVHRPEMHMRALQVFVRS